MKAKLSFLIALMLLTACKPLARHFLVTEPFSPKGLIRGRNGSHKISKEVTAGGMVRVLFSYARQGLKLGRGDGSHVSIAPLGATAR